MEEIESILSDMYGDPTIQVIKRGSGDWVVYHEQENIIYHSYHTTLKAASKEARKLSLGLGIYVTVNKNGIEVQEYTPFMQ